MNEDEIRDLFREMREEEVPADSLARVRLAVAERTATRPSTWMWRVVAGLLAMAAVVLVLLWNRPPASEPSTIARKQDTPATKTPDPVVRSTVERVPAVPKAAPRRIARKAPDRNGVLIRIETPDPDVVILLIADGAGE